jgi:hypothetical protein
MKPKVPTEGAEQRAIFKWASMMQSQYPILDALHAIPNGGFRNPREARNLKLQGVKPGVPDICLPYPHNGYHGLYIELKRVKGSKTSDNQLAWGSYLSWQGYAYKMCHGAEEAINVIKEYVGIK